jgi:hypothetical protein
MICLGSRKSSSQIELRAGQYGSRAVRAITSGRRALYISDYAQPTGSGCIRCGVGVVHMRSWLPARRSSNLDSVRLSSPLWTEH